MMEIRVFQYNPNGKIELTKAKLERLLNQAYEAGRQDSIRVSYSVNDLNNTVKTNNVEAYKELYKDNYENQGKLNERKLSSDERRDATKASASASFETTNTPITDSFDSLHKAIDEMVGKTKNDAKSPTKPVSIREIDSNLQYLTKLLKELGF